MNPTSGPLLHKKKNLKMCCTEKKSDLEQYKGKKIMTSILVNYPVNVPLIKLVQSISYMHIPIFHQTNR